MRSLPATDNNTFHRKGVRTMSMQAVTEILERALSDAAFREQLKTNFDATIKGYDLTDNEKAALKKGDETALRAMGVDQRLNKPWWR